MGISKEDISQNSQEQRLGGIGKDNTGHGAQEPGLNGISKEDIRRRALELGFVRCGVARAEEVSAEARARYRDWLARGGNDCMAYMKRYLDVRDDPRLLLPGARSVIVLAMNYLTGYTQDSRYPQIARYAYGLDYHEVVRRRLKALAAAIAEATGAGVRVCVDTAPLREKYWAGRAGVGFVGRNNLLIVPGVGSYCFLGEIVTTLALEPDEPCAGGCGECRACVRACPGGALCDDGRALDAGRCLSCQLIERRGPLPEWVAAARGNRLYGCDTCQQVCPHNRHAAAATVPELQPRPEALSLDAAAIRAMTDDEFARLFGHSAIRRAGLQGLKRNLGD